MNALNRLITVIAIIIAWLAIVLLAIAPDLALGLARTWLDSLETLLAGLAAVEPGWLFGLMRAGVALLVTLIALALLWIELRRQPEESIQVQLESGGYAQVTADSVAQRLAWHIDQLADVISVYPEVVRRGNGVEVLIGLETSPDIEIPMKTEEVMAVAREVIEDRMGLHLRKLSVEIRHGPFHDDFYADA